jgi:hypothetical protein
VARNCKATPPICFKDVQMDVRVLCKACSGGYDLTSGSQCSVGLPH